MANPHGGPPGGYGAPPPGQYGSGPFNPPPNPYGAPPPGAYGAPPPGAMSGAYPPAPGGYGAPPPGAYGAPPPGPYGAPGYGAPGYGAPGGYGAPPGPYGAPGGFNLDPFASMGGGYGAPPPGAYPPQQGGYGGYPPPAGPGGYPPFGAPSQYGAPPVGFPGGPAVPGMAGMPGMPGAAPGMPTPGMPGQVVYNVQLRGTKLDRKDFMSKSDPFLIIYAKQGGKMAPIHKTEMIKNNQNPIWKPFQLSLTTLGGADGRFKIECLDWDPNGNHDLIGSCETSINELRVLRELKLENKNKTLTHAAGLLSVITLEPAPPGTTIPGTTGVAGVPGAIHH